MYGLLGEVTMQMYAVYFGDLKLLSSLTKNCFQISTGDHAEAAKAQKICLWLGHRTLDPTAGGITMLPTSGAPFSEVSSESFSQYPKSKAGAIATSNFILCFRDWSLCFNPHRCCRIFSISTTELS